jgi:5-methyltetrahydropteroyltriglutamate--homocysteine methyltransferase
MFATYTGGYSRQPLPAQPDVLGSVERSRDAGRTDDAAYQHAADDFVREILHEMAVVGLGIVGDGGVRMRDRVRPWVQGLDGLRAGGVTTLPNGELVTRPVVDGTVTWLRPVTVRDWRFADGETDLPVKQTIMGPWTLAALAEPGLPARRASRALAFGDALNHELHTLAVAGCPMIEVDEPMALQLGDSAAEWAAFHVAHERLTAGFGDTASVHLSLTLGQGTIDRASHDALIELPYQSYGVDVLASPSAWRFIDAVPHDRGIIVGAADAASETLDETELLVCAMAWAAQGGRGSDRVGVAPNGSLHSIGRHFAHRKCQRLGEAVRVGSIGPLEQVAEALDDAATRRMIPGLQQMAAAVAEARRSVMPMPA